MWREELGLEQIKARIGRGMRLRFVNSRTVGNEPNEVGGGFEPIRRRRRVRCGLPNQHTLFAVLFAGTEQIGDLCGVLPQVRDVLLYPVGAEVRTGNNLREVQNHPQVAGFSGRGNRLRPPRFAFDRAILASSHQLQSGRQKIFAGRKQQVVAGNREGGLLLRLGIAAHVEVHAAGAARLELGASLPERRLHGFCGRQVSDVKELQVPDVIQGQSAASSGNLGKEVHVGGKSGSSSELTTRTVKAQQEARAGKDFEVTAFAPLLFLRRSVPVRKECGKILGLQVKQRASRDEFREWCYLSRIGSTVTSPAEARARASNDEEYGDAFHGFTPPFGVTALGPGAERANNRGRTMRSCSRASCSRGWRPAFCCCIRNMAFRSAI